MSAIKMGGPKFFGIFELDAADTVLYSRLETVGRARVARSADLSGLRLFDGLASFSNSEEMRQQIADFRSNGERSAGFDFTCCYEDGDLPVRVLLARVLEVVGGGTKSVLIHVRPRDGARVASDAAGQHTRVEKRK
jgi:hypothetical protein